MSMITTSTWVPRGFAAPFPSKYTFDEAEFERIAELAKLQLDDAEEDLKEAQEGAEEAATPAKDAASEPNAKAEKIDINDADLKEYDLEHYDDDEEDEDEEKVGQGEGMAMFGNIKSLAYYESNKEDPYITLDGGQDDDEEDREDLQILATDNLLLAAKVEDEMAHLEVYVYEDTADNLYVHHDIMLPAIPLCVEWLDIPVQKAGVDKDSTANFVAIGTMDPDIEVWDLDTVDCMYPNAILGQAGEGSEERKKKKKKKAKANDEYHVDAVLALAANRKHRNLLASASADKTVKLWDLHTAKCAKSYTYHTDKVCSLAWHSVESTVLLSGSYDRTVVAADMRAPDAKAPRWGVESDVENIRWDPHDPNYFYVSTENGIIHFHDVRNAPSTPEATKAVWTLQAHDESVSSFDINPVVPGFMATGSTDKTVKLWNIQASGPSMVVSRNLDVGKVFSTQFAPDPEVAFRLAVAGSRGTMHVWDTSTNPAVRHAFAERVPQKPEGVEDDRLVGVAEDDSSSSEDEDEDEDEDGEKDGDSMDEDED
ncbi:WD domain-containing protein [Colletotrichum plurivorum]|uniref:WD domain-containing protein n=1 Tax=Colletotrichum plurivorum TaxID=2175906 RepID=A0A8H6U4G1_9PEZI|nr:WD domain-containing protein [Colletotrichum plurivorum]